MKEQIYEGMWEDMLLRSDEFAGRLVKLTLVSDEQPPKEAANLFHASPEERARALDAIAEMNKGLPILPEEAYNRESLYDEGF